MRTLHLLHQNYTCLLFSIFHWVSIFKRFQLGNTRTKHNQLPAITWNFYYDAKSWFKQVIVS